jgi:hypothetical protein
MSRFPYIQAVHSYSISGRRLFPRELHRKISKNVLEKPGFSGQKRQAPDLPGTLSNCSIYDAAGRKT